MAAQPKFDFQKFVMATLTEAAKAAKPELLEAIQNSQVAVKALTSLASDVTATVTAIQGETDRKKLEGLQHDLDVTLPARKAAIRSPRAARRFSSILISVSMSARRPAGGAAAARRRFLNAANSSRLASGRTTPAAIA